MDIDNELTLLLTKVTNLPEDQVRELVEIPPDPSLGDRAFPCFRLAKMFKKSPVIIASELAKQLEDSFRSNPDSIFRKVEAVKAYINFFVDEGKLSAYTVRKILTEAQTYGDKPQTNETVVVESPSPNTNKPLHLGHLRNIAIAESMCRVFESQGFDVKRVNLFNDRGVHICKSMLAYKRWGENKQPDKKSDHFVGDYYVLFSQKAADDPNLEDEAKEMLRDWEAGDPEVLQLWELMNNWAYEGFEQTFERFGVSYDQYYYESQVYREGRDIILKGLEEGRFFRHDSGAVIADLGQPLGEKVLLRSDGTSVYITQDIYLAKKKYDDFHYAQSIYVVASEQNYHFQVLFKLVEKLGFEFSDRLHHLSYGMVYLPEGKMKSREGTVVDADDLLDQVQQMALEECQDRFSSDVAESIATRVALAAVKYYILKFTAPKDFTYNPKEAISFEGDTGPYLLYSYVRANRIIEKFGEKPTSEVDYGLLTHQTEAQLVKELYSFPQVLESATRQYAPHLVSQYAFKLATQFSMFYEKCRVIGAESPDLGRARLALVGGYRIVIRKCLTLLGIEPVEAM